MVAEAGLVPWAESGISTFVRLPPWAACQARISSSPVSSPWAPAAGWRVAAAVPVMAQRARSRAAGSTVAPSGHRLLEGGGEGVDVGPRAGLRHRDQEGVAQLGIVGGEVETAEEAGFGQPLEDEGGGLAGPHGELVEGGGAHRRLHA